MIMPTAKKTKHAGGRPTKYKPEYATDEFVQEFVKHCKKIDEVISLCGLAVYVQVCEDTLQEWKSVHPEFSVSLNKIKQLSKNMLFNMGLKGDYNSAIVKLGLSANHGMSETTKQEHGVTKDFADIYKDICANGKAITISGDKS